MKKVVIILIIIILLCVFVGLVFKKIYDGSKEEYKVDISEIEKIEKYINSIYFLEEQDGQALYEFENINEVDNEWFWNVVKNNLDEKFQLTYEELYKEAEEIFGDKILKEFPTEGNGIFVFENILEKYIPTHTILSNINGKYILGKIEENENQYIVEIIEYKEEYIIKDGKEIIIITNLDNEKIFELELEKQAGIVDAIKNNVDEFTKKEIILSKNGEKIYIEKCRKK